MQDFSQALNYAYLLLKYRARGKREISERLRRKKYSPPVIKETIDHLEKSGYINDSEFSLNFAVSCREKGWGPEKIKFKLKKLGITDNLIQAALEDKAVFREKIKELAEHKLQYYRGPKRYRKIIRFLAARGFAYADIYGILGEMGIEPDKG